MHGIAQERDCIQMGARVRWGSVRRPSQCVGHLLSEKEALGGSVPQRTCPRNTRAALPPGSHGRLNVRVLR